MSEISAEPFISSGSRKRKQILAVILLVVSVLLTVAVAHHKTTSFDSRLLLGLHHHTPYWLEKLSVPLSYLGETIILILATGAIMGYLLKRNDLQRVWFLGLSMAGSAIIVVTLKSVIARPRPHLWYQLVNETNFSFPSGHAMGTATFALVLLAMSWHRGRRAIATAAAIVYVFVVGFSRLCLGVHYPTDILGGWLLSAAWVLIVWIGMDLFLAHRKPVTYP